MRILIQGAGIAGLTLAVALRRRGIEALVIEKASRIGAVGAGITLGANALVELESLLDLQGLRAHGKEIQELRVCDEGGKVLLRTPGRADASSPAGIAVRRHHLHHYLSAELPPEQLRTGIEIREVREVPYGVHAVLSDGSEQAADFLVGADGIRSSIRARYFPGIQPEFSGYTCWRAVVPGELPDAGVALELWGSGRRMGLVPLAECELYIFATLNVSPAEYANRTTDRPPDFLRSAFAGFSPLARSMWGRAIEGALLHNDLEEIKNPVWGKGRVLLIGDAAHAMTPNLGQGAAMGIEDAVVLAETFGEIREGMPPGMAAVRLRERREKRVTWIAGKSRELGEMGQWEGRFKVSARNLVLASAPPFLVRRNIRRVLRRD